MKLNKYKKVVKEVAVTVQPERLIYLIPSDGNEIEVIGISNDKYRLRFIKSVTKLNDEFELTYEQWYRMVDRGIATRLQK